METKGVTEEFYMRGTFASTLYDFQSTMESIENIFEQCDLILENVQMSLTGYKKQTEQIEKVFNGMAILNNYALSAHDQAYYELDHPLMVGFANGATKRLSEIKLNEITTENTFHMEEYYKLEAVDSETQYEKYVKLRLTLSDFMGIGWMEDGEGTPTLENVETVGIFAQLFRLDYKNMAPEDKDLNEYLNDFLTDAEFLHRGYHPLRDFLSMIADVTIILPLVEGIMGYDFITQEELTGLERGFKIGGALVDALTLGASGVFTNVGMWATTGVILKTMATDAALSGVTYVTNGMLVDAGLPPAVAAVMTVIASGVVTYSAGKYFFKNASGDLVAEYTESELRQIFNEIDNVEIPEVKGSAFEEAIKGGSKTSFNATPELEAHIRNTDPSVPRKRGIGGAHNSTEFFQHDVEIISETPSKIPGVSDVEYRMPKLNPDGTPTGEYGAKTFRKTIYNPDIISDDEFIKRGLEAANDAINKSSDGIMPREWTGVDSKGISWHGYYENGEITSFFPEE